MQSSLATAVLRCNVTPGEIRAHFFRHITTVHSMRENFTTGLLQSCTTSRSWGSILIIEVSACKLTWFTFNAHTYFSREAAWYIPLTCSQTNSLVNIQKYLFRYSISHIFRANLQTVRMFLRLITSESSTQYSKMMTTSIKIRCK